MFLFGGGEINGEDDVKCEAPLITIKPPGVVFPLRKWLSNR